MIAVVIGTQAEYLRTSPVLEKLHDYTLVLTGQNEVDADGIRLKGFQGVGTSIFKGMWRFLSVKNELAKTLRKLRPSMVLYQGDTVTTLLAAMVAQQEYFQGAHIEAGFRSHSLWSPFPEEITRKRTDSRSTLLFAPSLDAWNNLFGTKAKVVLSGSTVWDNLQKALPNQTTRRRGYAVMTAHRYESILFRDRLKRMVRIASLSRLPCVWPMHEMTKRRIKDAGLWPKAEVIEPLTYPKFLELIRDSNFVLTDGGALEEEAAILRKPCVLLRTRTERPEVGSRLVGLDIASAAEAIRSAEDADTDLPPTTHPYYFNKSPSEIIAENLA